MEAISISREIDCVYDRRYPGVPVTKSACDDVKKAREGTADFYRFCHLSLGKKPRSKEAQGGMQVDCLAKPQA